MTAIYRCAHIFCAGILSVLPTLIPDVAIAKDHPGASVGVQSQGVLDNLPLTFEENSGQVNSDVKFFSRGSDLNLYFTEREAVMVFNRSLMALNKSNRNAVVRMRFEKSNKTPRISGENKVEYNSNYFIGEKEPRQYTDIKNYTRIKYESIYPGVDLVYYDNQKKLEYDLIVKPNANPSQIKIEFSGANKVALTQNGELSLETDAGKIIYQRPIAYQDIDGERKAVESKYKIQNGKISFYLGSYDKSKMLVIDPLLSYSSFLWGVRVTGVAVDTSGNAYVTGSITTSDLPATGGYQAKKLGTQDAYVAKINPAGNGLVYATYIGVRQATITPAAIQVDSLGNAYIAGSTSSNKFPVTLGAYQTTASTVPTSFVTKLNPNGNGLVYSTYLNGASIAALKVDSVGSLYITGNASAVTTTTGAFQTVAPYTSSPFIAKLNPAGAAMDYVTYLGGSGADVAYAIDVDKLGNAYVTGSAISDNFPVKNPYQGTRTANQDAFVSKLNPNGSDLIYSTYLGGYFLDRGYGIAVDALGQAHVVGITYSPSFPVTSGSFQPTKGEVDPAVSNAFITKFSSTGDALLYSSFLGGAWCLQPGVFSCFTLFSDGIDAATAVAVDPAGYAYMTGFATSIRFPQTEQIQAIGAANGDASRTPFVAKISPDGSRKIYSVVLGERTQDVKAYGIALDQNGSAYVAGYLNDAHFPFTAAPLKTSGQNFIFKLSTGKNKIRLVSSDPSFNGDYPITLTATVLNGLPGGSITFKDGEAILGGVPVVNGVASITTLLAPGIHKITATLDIDGTVSAPLYQKTQYVQ